MSRTPFAKGTFLLLLLTGLVFGGCSRKSEPPSSASPFLKSGSGAVLVIFVREIGLRPDNWMAQVLLEGTADTKSLPRLPLPELQTMMVTNVPAGFYRVTAWAWVQRSDGSPLSGGSLGSVEVRSGDVTVLIAERTAGDRYPFPATSLRKMKSVDWTAESPDQIRSFVAEIVEKTAKG